MYLDESRVPVSFKCSFAGKNNISSHSVPVKFSPFEHLAPTLKVIKNCKKLAGFDPFLCSKIAVTIYKYGYCVGVNIAGGETV